MLSDNQVVMGMDEEFSSPSPATKEDFHSEILFVFYLLQNSDYQAIRPLQRTIQSSNNSIQDG